MQRRLSRRAALQSVVAALLAGCASRTTPRVAGIAVHGWFDLPNDTRSRELSGIAWDTAAHCLWAVQDESVDIISLLPDAGFQSWTFGPVVRLDRALPHDLDLEGIAVLSDGFVVAAEQLTRLIEVDREGRHRRDVPLSTHFAKVRKPNRGLESLTISPDQQWLFVTTETSLESDGPTATLDGGAWLRILRLSRAGAELDEYVYRTDPLPRGGGDYGVTDLAAVSNGELVVLERGYTKGYGNTARIYRVRLDATASCTTVPELGPSSLPLAKELVVDLAILPAKGLPRPKEQQPAPILDNYEGIALGPRLPDGRLLLFLVSDDNARPDQIARIVVLALG